MFTDNVIDNEENFLLNIDVLGFGDFIRNNNLEFVTAFYSQIITGSAFSGQIIGKDDIEVLVYSDTIAIKSKNQNKQQCLYDLVKIANMIQVSQYYSFIGGGVFLPFRGTITYGKYVFHKGDVWHYGTDGRKIFANNVNLIYGKPIVESYELEKMMEIICIAIADSIMQKEEYFSVINHLLRENLLVEYNIPLKKNKIKDGLLVNPVFTPHIDIYIKNLETERVKFKSNTSIFEKYTNTIELFSHINKNELFFPNVKNLQK